jgi:hypothetical protein
MNLDEICDCDDISSIAETEDDGEGGGKWGLLTTQTQKIQAELVTDRKSGKIPDTLISLQHPLQHTPSEAKQITIF